MAVDSFSSFSVLGVSFWGDWGCLSLFFFSVFRVLRALYFVFERNTSLFIFSPVCRPELIIHKALFITSRQRHIPACRPATNLAKLLLLFRHECFTRKYTTRKINKKLHPGPECGIFHILASKDIDDVISRFFGFYANGR